MDKSDFFSKYRTVFILPPKTKKHLTDDGWEFSLTSYIPISIENILNYDFEREKGYEDDELSYTVEDVKINVLRESDNFSFVYIRIYSPKPFYFSKLFSSFIKENHLEVFVPKNDSPVKFTTTGVWL